MVSWDTNLVVLGGDTGTSMSSSLYQLEYKNDDFTWQTMETKMSEAKDGFVALKIPHNLFGPYVNLKKRKRRQDICAYVNMKKRKRRQDIYGQPTRKSKRLAQKK